jgi:bacillithiol system protein YtxJ
MRNDFSPVRDEQAWEELVARSLTEPVIVFKHSMTCGVSAAAYRELESFGGRVNIIEIQRSPSLSDLVEKLTGVTHESPQVIVLRRGRAVWNGSHRQIKASAVETAVRENG